MIRHRASLATALIAIAFFAHVGIASALEWNITKMPSGKVAGSVRKVSPTRYRVYTAGSRYAGKVVKKTTKRWAVIKAGKRIGTVKKVNDSTFSLFKMDGTKIGQLKADGDTWVIQTAMPFGEGWFYAGIGTADKSYPGAPTLGAGRVLLW